MVGSSALFESIGLTDPQDRTIHGLKASSRQMISGQGREFKTVRKINFRSWIRSYPVIAVQISEWLSELLPVQLRRSGGRKSDRLVVDLELQAQRITKSLKELICRRFVE